MSGPWLLLPRRMIRGQIHLLSTCVKKKEEGWALSRHGKNPVEMDGEVQANPPRKGEKKKSGCRNDSPPAHEIPKEPDRKRTQQRAGAFLEVVAQFTTRHKSSLFPSLVTPTPPLTLSPKLLALFTRVCSLADYNRVNSSSSYYSSVGSCSF